MELIYLVTGGDMLLKMDEVTSKPATQFLFIAEYLIRKNQIEVLEQKQEIERMKNRG